MNARSLGLGWLSTFWLAAGGLAAMAAEPVPVVPVGQPVVRDVVDYADFTGRTEPALSVVLRARVTGYLDKVLFADGAAVRKGDRLFQIDSRPYRAELDKAEAAVALSAARLKRAEAELQRATDLLAKGGISQGEFERIEGARAEALASVNTARAARELARLNLDFTVVTAPIDGRISRRLLDAGNVVRADETALATIVNVDPMYVYFDMDERTTLQLRRPARAGSPKDEPKMVSVRLADEEGFPHRALLDWADLRVDTAKGAVPCRAVLPNPRGFLMPGLNVHVRVPIGEPHQALLIPEQAVTNWKGEMEVLLVNDKNVLERRVIVLGFRHGSLREVKHGLKPDDAVVLRRPRLAEPGMKVQPQSEPAPKEDNGKDRAPGQ
jgi:RND family efflux transporter MFP subunit